MAMIWGFSVSFWVICVFGAAMNFFAFKALTKINGWYFAAFVLCAVVVIATAILETI